jgi:hypothetical protein
MSETRRQTTPLRSRLIRQSSAAGSQVEPQHMAHRAATLARFSKFHGVNAVGAGKSPSPVLTEPRPLGSRFLDIRTNAARKRMQILRLSRARKEADSFANGASQTLEKTWGLR